MSFRVTVLDTRTGDTETKVIPEDDYFLLTTGECYVAHIQTYLRTGTHVLTIKGRKEVRSEQAGTIRALSG